MKQIIVFLENAGPFEFCFAIIGLAIVVRIVYEIISDK